MNKNFDFLTFLEKNIDQKVMWDNFNQEENSQVFAQIMEYLATR